MRYLHPAAAVGLVLNFLLAYTLLTFLGSINPALLPPQEQELIGAMIESLPVMRTIFYLVLTAQAAALLLICLRFSFGLPIACVAAFFMLPASLVYLLGCVFSHYRVKYDAFPPAPKDYAGAEKIFASSGSRKSLILAGAMGLCLLLASLLNSFDLSVVFFCLILVALYLYLRSRSHHALSLHQDYFTITPSMFSGRLLIPYESVRLATLLEDGSIHFQVETPEGLRLLGWSLKSVEQAARRDALESLGGALAEHQVPLQ